MSNNINNGTLSPTDENGNLKTDKEITQVLIDTQETLERELSELLK